MKQARNFLFILYLLFTALSLPAGAGEKLPPFKMPQVASWPAPKQQPSLPPLKISPDGDQAKVMQAAEAGDAGAQYWLATSYRKDLWAKDKDMAKAIYWYRKAVENGSIRSALELGKIYFPFDAPRFEVPPDIVTSYVWRVIAQAGINTLPEQARKQYSEEGNEQEALAAMQYLIMPSELKRANAILSKWPGQLPPEVATGPVMGKNDTLQKKQKLSPETINTLKKLVDAGDVKAMKKLVNAYAKGQMPNDDPAAIFAFFLKAAAKGISEATTLIGWSYLKGIGVKKDETKGLAILEQQAARQNNTAYMLLGQHARKSGTKQETVAWFGKCAARNDTRCMQALGTLYRGGDATERAKALQWNEKAAQLGDEDALMKMVEHGESKRDIPELCKWMALVVLRTKDPMVAYRSRMMLAYITNGAPPEVLKKCMNEAESWNKKYPLPPKKKETP